MMDMIRNTDWTADQAMKTAQLMLDPKTNGGVDVQALLGQQSAAPLPLPIVTEMLAHFVKVHPLPLCLVEDGERLLQISADPYDPNGRADLHFSARGFTAEEVRPHLAAFMEQYPAKHWVAIGRKGLWRLICQPLGFELMEMLSLSFWATKDTTVSGKVVH